MYSGYCIIFWQKVSRKQAGKYPYFISLFNIGPYDWEKKSAKKIEEFQNL